MRKDPQRKTKVLVIDPSPLARKAITEALRASEVVEVVGGVSGARAAERAISRTPADVLVFDTQAPVQVGIEEIRDLCQAWPIPIVLLTELEQPDCEEVVAALELLPTAVLLKPRTRLASGIGAMVQNLESALRKAHQADMLRWRKRPTTVMAVRPHQTPTDRVIVLGASTGGTEAIADIVAALPSFTPGLAIVQHMPAGFTRMFAERLDTLGELEVREAQDGDSLRPGLALVAPGGLHLELARSAGGIVVRVVAGAKVNGHCPSVDVLMRSAARHIGMRTTGVLLTGMGNDGALGMKAIRDIGGHTIAQDEATSVVYGMPREAFLCGGAERVVPLSEIAQQMLLLAASECG